MESSLSGHFLWRLISFGSVAVLVCFASGAAPVSSPDLTGVEYLRASPDYRVWVNGTEQFVYQSLKTGGHGSHDIGSISFLNFDLAEPVEIKVQPRAKVATFAVRPYGLNLKGDLADNIITFKLTKPEHVVVTINESYDPVLVVSAQPPQPPPDPESITHYFGPGVHDVGKHLQLASGDRVYVARGAIVKGGFALRGVSNVRITGRGIVYNGHFPHEEAFRVFKGDSTSDVLIEGVTVTHSPGWIVSFWEGNTNLTVRDVTMVGNWWMNSDGVQTGTEKLLVENCFMQCNDDNFSLNGVCKDVVIRNNLLWNIYNGGVFMLGWATGQQFDLQDIDIHDNVILRAGGCCDYDRKAPISMKLFGSNRTARDIRIKNLVVEDLVPFGRWIDLQATRANRSTLRDFSIENVQVLKSWKVEGEVAGSDNTCQFVNVSFRNVEIIGKAMTTPAEGGLNLIQTANVTINGKPFRDVVTAGPDPATTSALTAVNDAGQGQPAAGPNLLANSDFAEGLKGWSELTPGIAKLVAAPDAEKAVLITKRNGSGNSIEQDVTDILRQQGPGDYTWAASVRGAEATLPVKATIVIEDETGVQQHPAPDVQVTPDAWVKTERRTPLKWGELKQAKLRVESNWGALGEFYVHECWLSK